MLEKGNKMFRFFETMRYLCNSKYCKEFKEYKELQDISLFNQKS